MLTQNRVSINLFIYGCVYVKVIRSADFNSESISSLYPFTMRSEYTSRSLNMKENFCVHAWHLTWIQRRLFLPN